MVKINKVWVELERYSRDEIMQMLMDPTDDLALVEKELQLLCNWESRLFRFYITKSKGEQPLLQCREQLEKMKAYDQTCHLIYKIWLPEGECLPVQDLRNFAHSSPMGDRYSPNPRFAVGHDSKLKPGEVRLLMINFQNYFLDRCPEDYELEWAEKCETEPITMLMEDFPRYKKILDDANSEWTARLCKEHTSKWYVEYCKQVYYEYLDCLIRYCIEDLQYYEGLTWQNARKALAYFLEFGSSVSHALFNFLEQAEAHIRSEKHSSKAVAFFLRAALWALKKGAFVNWYANNRYSMDYLLEIKKNTDNKTILSLIQKLENIMRNEGAITIQERESNTNYFKELDYIRWESMAERKRHNASCY